MRQRGFTLIELLAVLVLMGLLSAAVGISLTGRKNLADKAEILDRIKAFDARARVIAEGSSDPVSMVFDLGKRRVWLQDDERQTVLGPEFTWPEALSIREVRVGQHTASSGSMTVPLSRRGASPSYAFTLAGPSGKQESFFVVGLTGQVLEIDDPEKLQNLFRLAPEGNDAP